MHEAAPPSKNAAVRHRHTANGSGQVSVVKGDFVDVLGPVRAGSVEAASLGKRGEGGEEWIRVKTASNIVGMIPLACVTSKREMQKNNQGSKASSPSHAAAAASPSNGQLHEHQHPVRSRVDSHQSPAMMQATKAHNHDYVHERAQSRSPDLHQGPRVDDHESAAMMAATKAHDHDYIHDPRMSPEPLTSSLKLTTTPPAEEHHDEASLGDDPEVLLYFSGVDVRDPQKAYKMPRRASADAFTLVLRSKKEGRMVLMQVIGDASASTSSKPYIEMLLLPALQVEAIDGAPARDLASSPFSSPAPSSSGATTTVYRFPTGIEIGLDEEMHGDDAKEALEYLLTKHGGMRRVKYDPPVAARPEPAAPPAADSPGVILWSADRGNIGTTSPAPAPAPSPGLSGQGIDLPSSSSDGANGADASSPPALVKHKFSMKSVAKMVTKVAAKPRVSIHNKRLSRIMGDQPGPDGGLASPNGTPAANKHITFKEYCDIFVPHSEDPDHIEEDLSDEQLMLLRHDYDEMVEKGGHEDGQLTLESFHDEVLTTFDVPSPVVDN
jgi:hypothetical protein